MASELLDLGLTQEEIMNEVTNMGDFRLSESPAYLKPKKRKDPKTSGTKKKNDWIDSSDPDESFESSDSYSPQFPRGVPGYTTKLSRGRGGPFNPNTHASPQQQNGGSALVNYRPANHTYHHFNNMQRNLNPLIEMTNSSQFRNENIEKFWKPNQSSGSEVKPDSRPVEKSNSVQEISFDEQPIQKVPNLVLNNDIVDNKIVLIKSPQPAEPSEKSYKDILKGKTEALSLSDVVSDGSSDGSSRRRKDLKVKTALYIPPHLRKRNEEKSDSSSSVSEENKPIVTTEAEKSKPVRKKTVAELCKKNVLISTLLKKQSQQELQYLPQSISSENTDESSCLGLSSCSILSDVSSKPPSCDTASPPNTSDHWASPRSPTFRSDRSIPSSPVRMSLVDFNDEEEDSLEEELVQFHREDEFYADLPVRPPPEFADTDSTTHWFFDEEIRDYVSYTIPNETKENEIQTIVPTARSHLPQLSRSPLISRNSPSAFTPVQPRAATGVYISDTTNCIGFDITPGRFNASSTGTSIGGTFGSDSDDSPGYATDRGFWPTPGEKDFPPLP